MSIAVKLTRVGLSLFLLLGVSCAVAQRCPRASIPDAPFETAIKDAKDADVIYRSAAIAGARMLPVLHQVSKPDMPVDSPPGAAQVSLAKLGDAGAFSELEHELKDTRIVDRLGDTVYGGYAVQKLLRVASTRSISILMEFFVAHQNDASMHRELSDYSIDLRSTILRGLQQELIDPPDTNVDSGSYIHWVNWWEIQKHSSVPLTFSADHLLDSSYLQCLGRKVEWGFPDAIIDMGNSSDSSAIPALRILERVGPQIYTLNSIRGRARLALAKLGEDEAFSSIEQALYQHGSTVAIDMLWKIGDKRAVAALVGALQRDFPDNPYVTSQPPSGYNSASEDYGKRVAEFNRWVDILILQTLHAMVVNPPHFSGDPRTQGRQWLDWWLKNREAVRLISRPIGTYE